MRELVYYVAASIDGCIAGPAGEVDAFDASAPVVDFIREHYPETLPTPARGALGVDAPNRRFDTVLMGRSTYEVGASQGLASPYAHLQQVVFSSTLADPNVDGLVVATDPAETVRSLKSSDGLGVWLCGGGVLAGALIDQIDVLVVKRQPLILGRGRPLFAGNYSPRRFDLVDRREVGSIVVETHRRVGSESADVFDSTDGRRSDQTDDRELGDRLTAWWLEIAPTRQAELLMVEPPPLPWLDESIGAAGLDIRDVRTFIDGKRRELDPTRDAGLHTQSE